MALTPLLMPSRAFHAPSNAALAVLSSALRDLRISASANQRRNASHQAQGRANGAKDGPGKRLGAKKSAGEYVVPGNIIFKQRGTHWFPGDHCTMGRDHTIHAAAPGYVRYYRDPARHPKRQYIGIVFEKNQTLPQPPHAVRRRKLGMLAYQMPSSSIDQTASNITSVPPIETLEQSISARGVKAISEDGTLQGARLTLSSTYQYRQPNHDIARAAERKEVEAQKKGKTTRKFPEFKPGDRFRAWRRRSDRIARNKALKATKRKGKGNK